jgi:hypothetical protein
VGDESVHPSLEDASVQTFEEDVAAGIDDASDDWPLINSNISSYLSRLSSWGPLSSHCSSYFCDANPHALNADNFDSADFLADDHEPTVQQLRPVNMSARKRSIGMCSLTQYIYILKYQLTISYSCWYSDYPGAPCYR